jgi:hypothetical protein
MTVRPAERDLILQSGARRIQIAGRPGEKLRKWDQLEIVIGQWKAIERMVATPGPWVYVATRSRIRAELHPV